MVKRTGHTLIDKHPDKFSKDFDKNKVAIADVAEVKTKKLRNIIAGYITKKMKLADRE